jgi:hypothetical protein
MELKPKDIRQYLAELENQGRKSMSLEVAVLAVAIFGVVAVILMMMLGR